MASIAIIGTEASGKTVFICALAKYLESHENGRFLDPQNSFTQQYVERVWSTLQNREWPPSTPPGTLSGLHWKLHFPKVDAADLRIIDPGGQDIRRLFADAAQSPEEVPEDLQELADYCRSADIVAFLLNLRDFVGVADRELRTANELTLKFAMQYARTADGRSRHCCLVFTQIDLYRKSMEAVGTWQDLARRHLPLFYGAHLQNGGVPIFAVSAVNSTRVVVGDDKHPRRVPAKDFTSEGFDELLTWLEETEQKIAHYKPLEQARHWFKQHLSTVFTLAFLLIFVVSPVCNHLTTPAPTVPKPKILTAEYYVEEGGWLFNDDLILHGSVINEGATGTVTVTGTIKNGMITKKQTQSLYLKSGQNASYSLRFDGAGSYQNLDPPSVSAR